MSEKLTSEDMPYACPECGIQEAIIPSNITDWQESTDSKDGGDLYIYMQCHECKFYWYELLKFVRWGKMRQNG